MLILEFGSQAVRLARPSHVVYIYGIGAGCSKWTDWHVPFMIGIVQTTFNEVDEPIPITFNK